MCAVYVSATSARNIFFLEQIHQWLAVNMRAPNASKRLCKVVVILTSLKKRGASKYFSENIQYQMSLQSIQRFWTLYITRDIQGVLRLQSITAGGDFLGLCDEKIHINMCPILDGYGVMGIF